MVVVDDGGGGGGGGGGDGGGGSDLSASRHSANALIKQQQAEPMIRRGVR